MKQGQIRPIAICIVRRDDQILVAEWRDPSEGHNFYRPLGGAIEFGEHSLRTVEREFMEEIGAEVTDLRYLATLENIFIHNSQQGHEIVQIYEGRLVDRALYEVDTVDGHDDGGIPLKAVWRRLDSFGPSAPLYPDGLLELLTADAQPAAPRSNDLVVF